MCSPVKASDTASRWCKVTPVNSNKCLKVVFSPSLVGFTGGDAAAATKRRSFVVLKVLLKLFHHISSFRTCANEFNDPKNKQEKAFSLAHHKNCHENWGFFAH